MACADRALFIHGLDGRHRVALTLWMAGHPEAEAWECLGTAGNGDMKGRCTAFGHTCVARSILLAFPPSRWATIMGPA